MLAELSRKSKYHPQSWQFRLLYDKHTYIYSSIFLGVVLSHPSLPTATILTAMFLLCCTAVSALSFMVERLEGIKLLLGYEQVMVVYKDTEMRQLTQKYNELNYKFRKVIQDQEEAQKDLPFASAPKVITMRPHALN